jgi:hypothetical protein
MSSQASQELYQDNNLEDGTNHQLTCHDDDPRWTV